MKSKEEWSPELLQRMYEESPPSMRTVLEYLAARPDKWVPYGELNEAITSEESQRVGELSFQLGPFTTRCRNRYGMGWPFEKDPASAPAEGSVTAWMPGSRKGYAPTPRARRDGTARKTQSGPDPVLLGPRRRRPSRTSLPAQLYEDPAGVARPPLFRGVWRRTPKRCFRESEAKTKSSRRDDAADR